MAPSSSPFLFNNTPFQVYRPPGQGSAVRRRQKESQLRSQTNTHAPYSLQQNLTMHDKLKILDYCGGDSTKDLTQQEKVVQLHSMGYYTLSQSTLSTLLRDEDLLRAYADAHPEHLHMKRRPIVQLPHVEAALHEWILQKQDWGIRLTGDLIQLFTGYDPCDIFNADETALFFRVKLDKSCLTYLLCANMDGSEKRQPLIIGRARRPRCFGNLKALQLGFYYFWNQTAWMYQSIWETYLNDFNKDMKAQDRHILLLVDNAPTHRHNAANYSNIQVEFLPPNLTSWIQPMDAGIIQCFKSHYRNRFMRLALDRDDSGFENIYGINQLDAMSIASNAWAAVLPSTISNCWRHTGLITSPPTPNDDYSSREEQSLVEEMARHPRFMQPTFQRLWTVMGGQTQTKHEETDEEISRRIEVGLTLGE
ncbi:Tigger transposable element-derived protein 6 [Rhizoctonia solani AG-1 IB]|uniref:Tigger transposable element-derived protein 6 n=1 Tax=Thanatephorus cucumeris (strain AG1-IB / isolate 7/3/14) TaxID=1108050 RepID=M5C849_THACB|nr:Tigger transposable element-derived protein 6 [Rhizoctonia solani AG-1 IB]